MQESIASQSEPRRSILRRGISFLLRNGISVSLNFIEWVFALPYLYLRCYFIGKSNNKPIDIGLGPEPLINNIYHKKALLAQGFSVETFVNETYFITDDFDYRDFEVNKKRNWLGKYFAKYLFFLRTVSTYKCVYIYFNGGPFYGEQRLRRHEPKLFKLSKTKVVVMPYGGDVSILRDFPNLPYKHALDSDYPEFYKHMPSVEEQVRRWTIHADHVISGCDWVDFTYHWDTLTLAHFSIDIAKFSPYRKNLEFYRREYTLDNPLKILHAPNHKATKGSSFFIKAVEELKSEGYPVELVLLQGKPNTEVLEAMSKVDVVADQLIVGWYAMFSMEAMSMGKPVICYLRKDLIELYLSSGNLASLEELPHINSHFLEVKQNLLGILKGDISLEERSVKGIKFVEKYHSLEYIGKVFHKVNSSINIQPSNRKGLSVPL